MAHGIRSDIAPLSMPPLSYLMSAWVNLEKAPEGKEPAPVNIPRLLQQGCSWHTWSHWRLGLKKAPQEMRHDSRWMSAILEVKPKKQKWKNDFEFPVNFLRVIFPPEERWSFTQDFEKSRCASVEISQVTIPWLRVPLVLEGWGCVLKNTDFWNRLVDFISFLNGFTWFVFSSIH